MSNAELSKQAAVDGADFQPLEVQTHPKENKRKNRTGFSGS